MIHYMHIIRHLQGCSSEPDKSVLQCHLGKHIILPYLTSQSGPSTTARNGNVSHKMSDQRAYSLVLYHAERRNSQHRSYLPFCRGKIGPNLPSIDREIRCHKADTNFVPNHICIHQPSCRRCHAAFPPNFPAPVDPFKVKIHSPKGLNSARIISQDHHMVPSKCIHSPLRPQEACKHSFFQLIL